MTLIEKLKAGDVVRDSRNRRGAVDSFMRDAVLVRWEGASGPVHYADDDLSQAGVVKVSPFDDNAEDTEPGKAMVAGE